MGPERMEKGHAATKEGPSKNPKTPPNPGEEKGFLLHEKAEGPNNQVEEADSTRTWNAKAHPQYPGRPPSKTTPDSVGLLLPTDARQTEGQPRQKIQTSTAGLDNRKSKGQPRGQTPSLEKRWASSSSSIRDGRGESCGKKPKYQRMQGPLPRRERLRAPWPKCPITRPQSAVRRPKRRVDWTGEAEACPKVTIFVSANLRYEPPRRHHPHWEIC